MNYEVDLIHKDSGTDSQLIKHDPQSLRYGDWKLQETLEQILNRHDFSIKWIGNDPHANALAFYYCVLAGSLRDQSDVL